jgi:hypothetical protein
VDFLPCPVLLPFAEVVADYRPIGIFFGQYSPLTAGFEEIENAVYYPPNFDFSESSAGFGGRDERFDDSPLLVGEIRVVAFVFLFLVLYGITSLIAYVPILYKKDFFNRLSLRVINFFQVFSMKNKDAFASLIKNSSLSEDDKKAWHLIADLISEKALTQINNLFSEYPDQIMWFNAIFKKKKRAFEIRTEDKEKSQILFKNIFEEEKNKLNQLFKENNL